MANHASARALAVLALAAANGSAAAAGPTAAAMGPQSRATIGISVSVRPRFDVSAAAGIAALRASNAPALRVALVGGEPSGARALVPAGRAGEPAVAANADAGARDRRAQRIMLVLIAAD